MLFQLCKIVLGHGDCKKGIVSDDIKKKGMMLFKSYEFEFEKVLKLISGFPNPEPKKPLLLYVNLAIPFGATYIYRLYEIKANGNNILIINQSRGG